MVFMYILLICFKHAWISFGLTKVSSMISRPTYPELETDQSVNYMYNKCLYLVIRTLKCSTSASVYRVE